jgi:hypothetical protein
MKSWAPLTIPLKSRLTQTAVLGHSQPSLAGLVSVEMYTQD